MEPAPQFAPQPYQAEPSRAWTPLDNFNPAYLEALKKGRDRHNFVEANIVSNCLTIVLVIS